MTSFNSSKMSWNDKMRLGASGTDITKEDTPGNEMKEDLEMKNLFLPYAKFSFRKLRAGYMGLPPK